MRKPKPPNLVTLAVLTTITVVFWVFFSVYSVLTSEPETAVNEKTLESINPNLDRQILEHLDNKLIFKEGEVVDLKVKQTSEETAVVEPKEEIVTEESDQGDITIPTPTEGLEAI